MGHGLTNLQSYKSHTKSAVRCSKDRMMKGLEGGMWVGWIGLKQCAALRPRPKSVQTSTQPLFHLSPASCQEIPVPDNSLGGRCLSQTLPFLVWQDQQVAQVLLSDPFVPLCSSRRLDLSSKLVAERVESTLSEIWFKFPSSVHL